MRETNAEARRCYEQARTICHDLGDHVGLAAALEGMGNSARAMGHYGEARRYLREALQVSSQHMLPRIAVDLRRELANCSCKPDSRRVASNCWLSPCIIPPAIRTRKIGHSSLLSRYQATAEAAQQTSTNVDFEAVTTALLDELQIPDDMTLTRHTPHADETLIEPLSERELEVLTLIAEDAPTGKLPTNSSSRSPQ